MTEIEYVKYKAVVDEIEEGIDNLTASLRKLPCYCKPGRNAKDLCSRCKDIEAINKNRREYRNSLEYKYNNEQEI